jgi:CGNR zinc finger
MLLSMKQKQMDFHRALMAVRIERLHFAVRFAQMDLATLTTGDWLNLREDFLAFLGQNPDPKRPLLFVGDRGGLVSTRGEPSFPEAFTEKDFRLLQDDVLLILRLAVGDAMETRPACLVVNAPLVVVPQVGHGVPGAGYFTNMLGDTRDQFLFLLLDILRQEAPDRVLRCPQCGLLFVRSYTQEYCSRRCTNRASVQNYRKRIAADLGSLTLAGTDATLRKSKAPAEAGA